MFTHTDQLYQDMSDWLDPKSPEDFMLIRRIATNVAFGKISEAVYYESLTATTRNASDLNNKMAYFRVCIAKRVPGFESQAED